MQIHPIIDPSLQRGTAAGQILFWDGSRWVHTEVTELFWDDTNKRIGVNIATPQRTFHLNSPNVGTYFQITNSTTGSAINSGFDFVIYNNDVSIINRENGFLAFRTDNTLRIVVGAAGNIGIGEFGGGEIVPETLTEWTHAQPYLTLHNSTHEDSDGGRESRLSFKGEQTGGEETTLARIEVSHDGAADDEKGKIVISTNDGDDTDTPTDHVKIDAAGNTYIGDGGTTNYTKIEPDGTIEFNGTATVWKDINLGSALLTKPAASAPDTDEFKDEGGNDIGVETYAFAPGEKVSGNFELQHDYKEGSNFGFHVHFQGIAAPTGTDKVKWQLIYTVAKTGETLDAATTIVVEVDFDTQYEFLRANFAEITGTNFSIEDQFLFQLSRITASADEYGGDALIATVGLHYKIDTIGSRAVNTK